LLHLPRGRAAAGAADLRLAVISPFLDRRHGTERCVIEQLERFSTRPDVEIHIYAQQVADLPGVIRYESGAAARPGPRLLWHKVPSVPGPHILQYIFWLFANHAARWWDARMRGLRCDLVYSPGINALDADAITVHIVFQEFYRQVGSRLNFRGSPVASWPRRLHRRLYYRLIMSLENRIYARQEISLMAVSQLVANHLSKFFRRSDVLVVPNAVDTAHFTPEIRLQRRPGAREKTGLTAGDFALLLVGNDWEKKGLDTLLRSMAECRDLPFKLLVAGTDDQSIFLPVLKELGLRGRVQFVGSSGDVMQFYAAADVYAGPSFEDSFALPPLEAMACGLPVITSIMNGGSQAITEAVDGFVLSDPRDSTALAKLLRRLYEQSDLRSRIGENAARTAQAYTWDRNARETWECLMAALDKKRHRIVVRGERRNGHC
jgi:glycosyltransferase involved in cell wall biosynthesis